MQEDVHYENRCDSKQTSRFEPYDLLSRTNLVTVEQRLVKGSRELLERQSYRMVGDEERRAYVVVVPIPYDREEEYGKE